MACLPGCCLRAAIKDMGFCPKHSEGRGEHMYTREKAASLVRYMLACWEYNFRGMHEVLVGVLLNTTLDNSQCDTEGRERFSVKIDGTW